MRSWKIERNLFFSLILFSLSLEAKEVLDATQATTSIKETPLRIVTLAPSLGELAADLLGDHLEKIVGVSEGSDYPPFLKKLPTVGPFHQLNLEKIVSLRPDLVLATVDGNPKDKVLRLREMGIPVVTVSTRTFLEVEKSIELVAKSLNVSGRGEQMIARFKQGLQNFRNKHRLKTFKVMIQLGDNPIVVAGKDTFLQECLELLQLSNVYGDSKISYPRPSLEDILKRNPEVIVILAMENDLDIFKKMAQHWFQFQKLEAVQKKRIQILKTNTLARPTLRILEGLSLLENMIYEKKS